MKTSSEIKIIVVVNSTDGRVLMIKEKYPKKDRPLWNLIKGTYGDNNESIFDTAKREAFEEASVKIKVDGIIGLYILKKNSKVRAYFSLHATALSQKASPRIKSFQKKLNEDILEAKWFTKVELKKIKRDDFIASVVYQTLQDYLKGNRYPAKIFKQIK